MDKIKYLFYDIEVYPNFFGVCFFDQKNNKHQFLFYEDQYKNAKDISNFRNKLSLYIKDYILIGHNNYNYDDIILYQILYCNVLNTTLIYNLSQLIVNSKKKLKNLYYKNTLDCSFQWKDNFGFPISLKKTQANQGLSIVETEYDFDKPIKFENINEIMKYCENDVITTKNNFYLEERQTYFQINYEIWTTYFKDKYTYLEFARKRNSSWLIELFDLKNIAIPNDTFINDLNAPKHIKSIWKKQYNNPKLNLNIDPIIDNELEINFSNGGLHGLNNSNKIVKSNYYYYDDNSQYPTIVIAINLLGEKTKIYKNLYDIKMHHKDEYSKIQIQGIKLILNSLYGVLGIIDKRLLYNITFRCQELKYNGYLNLKKRNIDCLQINTDSLMYKNNKSIKKELDLFTNEYKNYHMQASEEEYNFLFQRDVNNYIAYNSKTKELSLHGCFKWKPKVIKQNNYPIVQLAINNKILFDKPIFETIIENTKDLQLYSYITSVSKANYIGVYILETNKKINYINRCFIIKEGITLYKLSKKTGNKSKLPNLPSNKVKIINDDINNLNQIEDLDLNWYVEFAQKQYEKLIKG